jgi:hypothetical protein
MSLHSLHALMHCCKVYAVRNKMSSFCLPTFRIGPHVYRYLSLTLELSGPEVKTGKGHVGLICIIWAKVKGA